MTTVIRSMIAWTKETTPRYVALALGGWMMAISFLGLTKVQENADLKTYEACVQRVGTRSDLRGALIGIFDYLDPERDSMKVNDLRAYLDAQYEPLQLEDC
jgi:hypothetical protein